MGDVWAARKSQYCCDMTTSSSSIVFSVQIYIGGIRQTWLVMDHSGQKKNYSKNHQFKLQSTSSLKAFSTNNR